MSDLSKLSQEDLEYLRDRGQLSPDQERELLNPDVVTSMPDDPTANPPTEPGQNLDVQDGTMGAGSQFGDDYLEGMSKAELQERLGEGNYPTSANKGELIDLIRKPQG